MSLAKWFKDERRGVMTTYENLNSEFMLEQTLGQAKVMERAKALGTTFRLTHFLGNSRMSPIS
jgi:hypothetical protein